MQFLILQYCCPLDQVIPSLFYDKVLFNIKNSQLLKMQRECEHQKHNSDIYENASKNLIFMAFFILS